MCPVFDIPVRFLRCHIEFSTSARYLPRLRLPGLPRNTLPAIGGSTPEHPRCVVRVAGPHGGQTLDTTFRYAGASPSALAARPPAAPRRVDDCLDARAGCSATSRQLAAPGPGTTWNNILDLHPGPAGRRAGPDHATLPRRPDAAGIHPLPGHTDTITIVAGAGPPPAVTAAPPHWRAGVRWLVTGHTLGNGYPRTRHTAHITMITGRRPGHCGASELPRPARRYCTE